MQPHSGNSATARRLGCLLGLLAWLAAFPTAAIQNIASGDINGVSLDLANAGVTLARQGNAATGVIAEIAPNSINTGVAAQPMIFDLLATLGAGDSGYDRVTLTAPAGYANLAVGTVAVGGTALTAACPSPGAGQYCTSIAGPVVSLALGTKVTVNLANLRIGLSADSPAIAGGASFAASIDDSSTPLVPPQAAIDGDADADAIDANSLTVNVVAGGAVDPSRSSVSVAPPIVLADGIAVSTVTVTLRDSNNQPVAGKLVVLGSDRGLLDLLNQPIVVTNASGIATGSIGSTTPGMSTVTATNATDGIVLTQTPQVAFTQGLRLALAKRASKAEAVVGEVLSYRIEIRNTTTSDVVQVSIDDQPPPGFTYLAGSARLDGAPLADPTGRGTLSFDIGTVAALVDTNGNGQADPGEPGYRLLSYQLVIGARATPGEHSNRALGRDVCPSCAVSNTASASVRVTLDPTFDLGTIIGKVFEDKNADGWQDPGEAGIPAAMVALDDGTYAITDEHGRYHFPAVNPGQRLVKINLIGMAVGAVATTPEAKVLSVTPGLLVKANFGVRYQQDVQSIGAPARTGISLAIDADNEPIQVHGSIQSMSLLLNGRPVTLPGGEVQLLSQGLEQSVEIKGGRLTAPVEFLTEVRVAPDRVRDWALEIFDARGAVLRRLTGAGAPPERIVWDGHRDDQTLIAGGGIYQYQLSLRYTDGAESRSARVWFGVNRTAVLALRLSGSAFDVGAEALSEPARQALQQAAETLRRYPEEQVLIEGHTDSQGGSAYNLELSRRRAQAALDYLIQFEQLPPERFALRGFGEARPIAGNASAEGREINRRVELRGVVQNFERPALRDQHRETPQVRINGQTLAVGRDGRFQGEVPATESMAVELRDARGRQVHATLAMPQLEIRHPQPGERRLAYGETADTHRVAASAGAAQPAVYQLVGRTGPDTVVELDGNPLVVADDGEFRADLPLGLGANSYSLTARNDQGYTRIANLNIRVDDRRRDGRLIIAVEEIPSLTVWFPPPGRPLASPLLTLNGMTDPDNQVSVNDSKTTVDQDGRFTHALTLPQGHSDIRVVVVNPAGRRGMITRHIEVTDTRLFLLALADGQIGQLRTRGNLTAAGQAAERDTYSDGRVAYYLKGVIAGKYLITSAYDSDKQQPDGLFKDLGETGRKRLLTNLDPDKYYPVYGDASTVIQDASSDGKFYLALDSDELHLLVGNYALDLDDTELARYARSLYGVRAAYQSLARSRYGQPDTKVIAFGAETAQRAVTDELRATGGSLYYLSHRDVIEGSEHVSLVVRDATTGLTLARLPQARNQDYSVQYQEGRLLFTRPLTSVATSNAVISQAALAGNPVLLQIDYEVATDALDQTVSGGRARQQLGDHIAVGVSQVQDESSGRSYELQGLDAELRLGRDSRIVVEHAESRGTGASTYVSDDGGLSFSEIPSSEFDAGAAWKLAAELDVGEAFGRPDRVRVGGYVKRVEPGFRANGNSADPGSRKAGAHVELRLGDNDRAQWRNEHEQLDAAAPGAAAETRTDTLAWTHQHGDAELTGELRSRETLDRDGATLLESSLAAARLRWLATQRLTLRFEHQQTLDGAPQDQTGVGADYRLSRTVSLTSSGSWGDLGDAALLGLSWQRDGQRVYLNQRLSDDAGGDHQSTVLGGESAIGPRSKVYTEYQWDRADREDRDIALVGAQREWQLTSGLKLLASGEVSEIDASSGRTRRNAVALGLNYADNGRWRYTMRNELRTERGATDRMQFLTSHHVEFKLDADFSLLGKYRISRTRDLDLDSTEAELEERSIGLAYRPVAHDRFNALARYTQLFDQRPLAVGEASAGRIGKDIVSTEWSYEINRHLEWVDKLAYKRRAENLDGGPMIETHTWLAIHRLNYHVTRAIDIGGEYRSLVQREADDRRDGWLTEVAWEPHKHLRLGVGYNFTDFSDNVASDQSYSTAGWFLRLQGKY